MSAAQSNHSNTWHADMWHAGIWTALRVLSLPEFDRLVKPPLVSDT